MIEDYVVKEVQLIYISGKQILTNSDGDFFEVEGIKKILFLFENNDWIFLLNTYLNDFKWHPHSVEHTTDKNSECIFCGERNRSGICSYLTKYVDELFQHILTSEVFRFQALSEFPK